MFLSASFVTRAVTVFLEHLDFLPCLEWRRGVLMAMASCSAVMTVSSGAGLSGFVCAKLRASFSSLCVMYVEL